MNNTWKWILGIGGVLLVSSIVAGGFSHLVGFADKFQVYIGTPRIHNIDKGLLNIRFDQVRIMNQSELSADLTNMFVTIQYQNTTTGNWENWMLQTNALPKFTLQANQLNNLPTINLSVPLDLSFVKNAITGVVGDKFKVITRFNFAGVSIPQEQLVDASAVMSKVRAFNWIAS